MCAASLAVATGCGGSGGPTLAASTQPSSSTSASPVAGMGTTILITASGFRPRILLAPMGTPVVWKNVSSSTQSVHLDNFGSPVDSGPIKPGGAWSFNPNAQLSIVYHSTYDRRFRGQLQVQLVGNQ